MEEFAQQLKCNGVDLAWWPLFLGSFQRDTMTDFRTNNRSTHPAFLAECMPDLAAVVATADHADFEETLP